MQLQTYSPFPHLSGRYPTHPSARELDTLRAETQTANEKSASAATQTAAMLSLNLRLQSTASKNHAKQIELEVKTIEAREIKELLAIIQVNLPGHHKTTDILKTCSHSHISPTCTRKATTTQRAATCSSSAWPPRRT
jgi:hypothetical protein